MGQQQLQRQLPGDCSSHSKSSQGTAEEFRKVEGAELTTNKSDRAHVGCKDLKKKSYKA